MFLHRKDKEASKGEVEGGKNVEMLWVRKPSR